MLLTSIFSCSQDLTLDDDNNISTDQTNVEIISALQQPSDDNSGKRSPLKRMRPSESTPDDGVDSVGGSETGRPLKKPRNDTQPFASEDTVCK